MKVFIVVRCLVVAVTVCGVSLVIVRSSRNMVKPVGIVIHHSAIPIDQHEASEAIEIAHKARGFGVFYWGSYYYTGYHYLILPNGDIRNGRPERCVGAHTAGYGDYLGICLVGNFSKLRNSADNEGPKAPTQPQVEALAALVRRLREKYQIVPDKVFLHKDLATSTECPGDEGDLLREAALR